jgi:hypothetical protein
MELTNDELEVAGDMLLSDKEIRARAVKDVEQLMQELVDELARPPSFWSFIFGSRAKKLRAELRRCVNSMTKSEIKVFAAFCQKCRPTGKTNQVTPTNRPKIKYLDDVLEEDSPGV